MVTNVYGSVEHLEMVFKVSAEPLHPLDKTLSLLRSEVEEFYFAVVYKRLDLR